MPNGKQLKPLIERRCAELGISLTEAARRVDRSHSWIQQLYNSERVQAKTIHQLAKALEVEPAYFFVPDIHKKNVKRKGKQ